VLPLVGGGSETFVAIIPHPILGKVRSMYIIDTFDSGVLGGFSYRFDPTTDRLIHIDQITSKIILVPHFNQALEHTKMCGISMWEAR
jgi:hypothetical protein